MASRKKRGSHRKRKQKIKRKTRGLGQLKKQPKIKKPVMGKVGKRRPQKKKAAKKSLRVPLKKPSPLKKLRAQLKKAKAQLAATKKKAKTKLLATLKKLREARVKRRVQLLKERAKRRKAVPKMIKLLPGLDEYERRRAILDILSTADDSDEYWDLVQRIADELDLTTYLVASIASPPRGGSFSVPMAA